EIMKLSGQEYVDIYATAAKRQIADEAKARAEEAKRERKQAAAGNENGTERSDA
ncbi:1-acyl-sn-glycerol-3-phosphate acyltransferase, partial [Streptomyces sp. SID7499]|nr:1-acyl-sn-glycerol-3-phosphate acyltransferase [Streptomyces sp. SID7499]